MNDPFLRRYIDQQQLRPARSIPVQQVQRKPSPKVVSVPIRFFSSEQPRSALSKESAALKIQTSFRGFLVRKSVEKIASIRNEVSEIERRIDNADVVESIRGDAKERLRVNETLMSLLLRLDSIRGVDCGVRDFRKAVINKAIALQEKVDSIVAANYQALNSAKHDSGETSSEIVQKSKSELVLESSVPCDEVVVFSENLKAGDDSLMQVDRESNDMKEFRTEIHENCIPGEAVDDCGDEEIVETVSTDDLTESKNEISSSDKAEVKKNEESGGIDTNKRNMELLEKLMVDNEKMMMLMSQMFERNELQTRMLNSLSQRVEHLEKALTCDKQKRKKKRLAL